ncbi:universal stress protein [Corynebacterium uropygiale]|uniref:Universal stress protein n=1 Tax=Corynebacterium uropygiale TaxID=1775911 RepID=A0A9X1QSK5_9CORY|nr:universal stress protein [Corynebacterium uropygiale]
MKYSRIAVGTDGSAESMKAVATAASLAQAYGAELTIVCAFYGNSGSLLDAPHGKGSTSIPVISDERAQEFLAEARRVAQGEGAQKIEVLAKEGSPVDVLLHAVEESGIELLVMGNRGVKTLAGRVFGNIPTGVARHANVDVMLVNTEKHP